MRWLLHRQPCLLQGLRIPEGVNGESAATPDKNVNPHMFRVILEDNTRSRAPGCPELNPRRRGVPVVEERYMLQERTLLHDGEDFWAALPHERIMPPFSLLRVGAVRLVIIVEVEVQADGPQ